MSKQFLRSATSVGANLRESRYAESSKDFVHKFKIALKECNETLYWLELLKQYDGKYTNEIYKLRNQCNYILKMICKSINTCNLKEGKQY